MIEKSQTEDGVTFGLRVSGALLPQSEMPTGAAEAGTPNASPALPVLSDELTAEERRNRHLLAILRNEGTSARLDDLRQRLAVWRPYSAATRARLEMTRNEWLRGVAPEQMHSAEFATLAWIFLRAAPEQLVDDVISSPLTFEKVVLKWSEEIQPDGEPLIGQAHIQAVRDCIRAAIEDTIAADFDFQRKPDDPLPRTDSPPN